MRAIGYSFSKCVYKPAVRYIQSTKCFLFFDLDRFGAAHNEEAETAFATGRGPVVYDSASAPSKYKAVNDATMHIKLSNGAMYLVHPAHLHSPLSAFAYMPPPLCFTLRSRAANLRGGDAKF